ncbi:MAG: hypothetical protein GXP62_05615, partial [Oligoflexia bacterium]|nr:hypothetical protein [Oligoflexia bacterium]
MKRRSFLALGASMGAMALGCSSGLHSELKRVAASAPDPSDFALLPDNPGFRAVGAWTGSGTGPLLAELNLNINDFMRPQREAQAITRWLDKVDELGLHPMELSFTGHVLTALKDVAPQVIARAKAKKHTITQHYRLLVYKHLRSTEREIYYTDPATLQLDRSRPGPVVLIQKTFGVTPRDEGGAIGDLLRRQWKEGRGTRDLLALGWDKLQRQDQIAHPDRIVAWALPNIDATDAHPHVEAYLRIRRLERDISAGARLDRSQLADRYVDLVRWSQVAREMGFDVSAIAGLSNLVDASKLPSFKAGFANFGPTDQEVASMARSISQNAEAVASSLEAVMAGLAQRTRSLPTIGAELAFKLSRLSNDQVWVTRLAWHASNDYTLKSWN